jgi:hypothetical protein
VWTVWYCIYYICKCVSVLNIIKSVFWACCLASVWSSWTLIFCACCHLFRIIYGLKVAINLLLFICTFRFLLFLSLEKLNILYCFIYFFEYFSVVIYSNFMLAWKNVFNIVFKLLSTNGANYMIWTWLWFFNTFGVFFILVFFSSCIFNIIFIFLI